MGVFCNGLQTLLRKKGKRKAKEKKKELSIKRLFPTLHGKPYFLFPDVLKRWSFQKNCAGIWSFLYYGERWYFFFPKIWSYPQAENERWSFSRKYTKIWYFLQMFWKNGLRWGTFFLVLPGKVVFLPRKHGIFSLDGKWERWPLSRHTRKHDIFNLICSTPPAEKNQRWSYPAKMHLKVIDTLDWHARKSSSNSLYLRGDLYRRFHILLSN